MKFSCFSLSALAALLCSAQALAICDAEFTAIRDIQGTGDSSPLSGQQLSTQGVVTAVLFQNSPAAGIVLRGADNKFTENNVTENNVTDNRHSSTANSLFIADATAAAIYQTGQLLQIKGTVVEHNNLTSLSQITDIKLCQQGLPVQPATLRMPLPEGQNWEQLEGALLQLEQTLTVNDSYDLARYGEITLAASRLMVPTDIMLPGKAAAGLYQTQQQRHMLVLDDASTIQNPDPITFGKFSLTANQSLRVGDSVSGVTGVLLQDARGYRLVPTVTPQFSQTNPRPGAPEAKPAKALRVASFNVLNYFNGEGQQPVFPTRRGASNATEFERQQAKTISALAALDADVIGLLEVENNGYSPKGALAQLTAALNKVAAKPYRFIITSEQPGNDAIKVALLYRPSTVSVEGKAAMLLDKPFDWGSRPPLAQSFRHLASNELVTVSINHFKSKGSCPKNPSDANADQQDGQACWNQLRTVSAKALSQWLATAPTGVKTDKQLILGDLNAYRQEDPLRALQQQNWQYLSAADGQQYSYVYRGRSGSLDHALASPALAAKLIQLQHWAINADEPAILDYNLEYKSPAQQQQLYAPTPYRSSDHDPVLATFSF
ncbi:ExeM/NucH family extracellular endonuclease [Rheinheimera muenzenbergensis]|uniref:ExeM/NucH family extracellular endonuclease n=1 Tax=Rheinheimera muenzenbergensis TaxID=1193628 RepID=A0ABU8C605_9GAMM